MFALELRLLTGRYVATSYNDRRCAEWPPHPARLYSALVATHFSAEEQDPDERRALEWLESLGAPELSAAEAGRRDDYTVFVPVNDVTVVGDFDRQEQQVSEAEVAVHACRRQLDSMAGDKKQRTKLEKELEKAEKKLREANDKLRATISAKTGVPAKVGKGDPSRAAALLPEHRVRQPRTFPGVTPESPVVLFVWPGVEANGYAQVLDRLAARVVRVGHSSSLVSLRVTEEVQATNHLPVEGGPLRLRVVGSGQLQRLEAAFAQHRETEPRIMPKSFQDYAPRSVPVSTASASLFGEEWLVLARRSGPLLPATRGPDMAKAVRGALFAHASEPLPEVLSGHQPDGAPSRHPHVAVVPLPFVGHPHADGLVRGVAVVLPRNLGLEERRSVYLALRNWEEAARDGGDDSDTPSLPLRLGRLGRLALRRLDHLPDLQALRPENWCRPARAWATVTPIALDRNPGDLRSRDPRRLAEAVAAAEEGIRDACVRIGLPAPVRMEVLPSALWTGVYKAKHFAPYPREEGRTRRVLTHAYVEFSDPVCGPVVLGAGRFLGLGLCKPLAREEA